MTKSILLIVAGTTIGTAAVALPSLDLIPPAPAAAATPAPAAAPAAAELVFTGMCDASAGLLVDANHLVVANDEDPVDTTLRVYDLRTPGAPVATIDATAALAPEAADAEVDLEGLTRFGSRFALIGSHSLKGDEGKPAPSRRRLVAFELSGTAPGFTLARPSRYTTLVPDAQAFFASRPEPIKSFVLDKPLGAKFGGLSIEALSASASPGELLIGLRSPLGPGDTAIVLPLKNAAAVLDTGARAVFVAPILLSLGKQGLRDLVDDGRGGYLLLAGEPGEGGTFTLWSWAGPASATPPRKVLDIPNEQDTSAEAIVVTPGAKSAWILFDEGERKTASGKKCKGDSVPPAGKSFRARRVDLPVS
jgi:Protein of unknown function (DUF3616)